MSLADVLGSHRVVVTVGSGGVGKTTTAAAMAVHAAMEGRKVLCLTIDPARRLANSLGLDEMRTSEQDVPRSLFESHGLECKGSLSAMMLDTKRTFDGLVEKYASDEESRDRILNNQIYQYVASSLAGTQEYMAMEKLHEVRKDPKWDLVVLDTPPTASALDFLTAPERLIDAIDSPAMRWFLQVFEGAGKEAFGLVGRGATVLLKGIGKITGLEFLEQVAEFVSGINDLFGGFKERAEQVSDALAEPGSRVRLGDEPRPAGNRRGTIFQRQAAGRGNAPRGDHRQPGAFAHRGALDLRRRAGGGVARGTARLDRRGRHPSAAQRGPSRPNGAGRSRTALRSIDWASSRCRMPLLWKFLHSIKMSTTSQHLREWLRT